MRILCLDIETSPHTVYVWGLWDIRVALNQIVRSGSVLCWSAKWLGEEATEFLRTDGSEITFLPMLKRVKTLMDEADVIVHYNGTKFDIPTLNKEFVKRGMLPPSPYKQVDLLRVVRREFKFASNKLDYVSRALGLGGKEKHDGFMLWVDCMNNNLAAWKKMEKYNRQDVTLLEKLYNHLLPWIRSHPNHSAKAGVTCCPSCGSLDFQSRGTQATSTMTYQRYHCQDCGTWFRGTKAGPKLEEIMTGVP